MKEKEEKQLHFNEEMGEELTQAQLRASYEQGTIEERNETPKA
ncbi:hypothetical protein [Shouchella lonarensis]|uniref:Uncharacterized protein n=1 Tax=Shouchella lonarensis TaxID=1464122 RepID=A0A1G6LVY8_9BACI|nr:hypothetical protein [Shouchella lonarensis]SDC47257.1 hypothetical protein SAMN05421737_10918 [Shouchella lonarensis]